jgi:predicted RNA methylase
VLASYGLLDGELPPTVMTALWHSGFSAGRNPFALCYGRRGGEGRDDACQYLARFGRTREEQVRAYYLWAQTVPRPLWRYFSHLPLSYFADVVADMVPPYAAAQLLVRLDFYRLFRDAAVLDLFSGVCGWLMAFTYLPSHYAPRRWIAVDADGRRLQVCRLVGRGVGVDVEAVRRDLSRPYVRGGADVVVGSPPCHEFSAATVSRRRDVGGGLALVESFLESAAAAGPELAVMEEAATTREAPALLARLLRRYGFSYGFYDLRDFGAIQLRRHRLIAWREGKKRG